MSDWLTLPDDLLAARDCVDMGKDFDPAVLDRAHDRICELEVQLLRLKRAIASQRAHRDMVGGKLMSDLELWKHVADVPWGTTIRGDG